MAGGPDRLIAQTAQRHHGCIRFDTALGAGLTRHEIQHRVRSGRWVQVHEAVYRIAGAPVSFESMLVAACWAGGLDGYVSHRSAAALYGVVGARSRPIEVSFVRWLRKRETAAVVHEINWLDDSLVTERNGVPVVAAPLLLLQLAHVGGPLVAAQAYDQLRRSGELTWEQVDTFIRVRSRRGIRGMRALRAVHVQRDPMRAVIESPKETELLRLILDAGLPEPLPQPVVRDLNGGFVCRADFGYEHVPVVVFYDSDAHHTTPAELAKDHAQRSRLQALGYGVVVARKQDLADRGRRFIPALRRELDLRTRRSA